MKHADEKLFVTYFEPLRSHLLSSTLPVHKREIFACEVKAFWGIVSFLGTWVR